MRKIRVLVVDDAVVVRKMLSDIIAQDETLELVGTAAHGGIALQRIPQLNPDVIILDVNMPEMDGPETLQAIRRSWPNKAVIMFGGVSGQAAETTLRCLALGAQDYLTKPERQGSLQETSNLLREELLTKVRTFGARVLGPVSMVPKPPSSRRGSVQPPLPPTASRPAEVAPVTPPAAALDFGPSPFAVAVQERPAPRVALPRPTTTTADLASSSAFSTARSGVKPPVLTGEPVRTAPLMLGPVDVLAIGCSTGGPNALSAVLSQLPGNLAVPIVIVQHMPPVFTRLLAERLTASTPIKVSEAVHGQALKPGEAIIAPGDFHMVLERRGTDVVALTNQDPQENSCRPAVDVLFRSVAMVFGGRTLAVVLTGMGQDGLRGCEHLSEAGAQIVVQDAETSVVWGMPGFVAKSGLAQAVLPLNAIAGEIVRRIGPRGLLKASLPKTGV
jgi:two-component system chemotaxis response regulator CheB